MALTISSNFARSTTIKLLGEKFAAINLTYNSNQIRERHILNPKPRLRNPTWFTKQMKVKRDELITKENEAFIQQAVQDKYTNVAPKEEIPTNVEWSPKYQRTGVIARKIGVYPLWLKTGEKIQTTLLEILDNHVVKHYLPEEYDPPRKKPKLIVNKKTCLILGAGAGDPTLFTREYCGLFNESGVIPKKILARFFVSPEAALPLGTLITAKHFQVGNTVDIRGKTIDRGFQGVMKRHGFKGMPASHGATKTHRRPGNIGGGGEKGRVWPGTKLPGHMGNTWRIAKGLKILRMNTKHNVIWVSGQAIPGETNSICYVFDTNLPLRKPEKPVPFPTYFQTESEEVPEDIYDESIHRFDDPSIIFREQK